MLERVIFAGFKLKAHKYQWCYDARKPMDWLGPRRLIHRANVVRTFVASSSLARPGNDFLGTR